VTEKTRKFTTSTTTEEVWLCLQRMAEFDDPLIELIDTTTGDPINKKEAPFKADGVRLTPRGEDVSRNLKQKGRIVGPVDPPQQMRKDYIATNVNVSLHDVTGQSTSVGGSAVSAEQLNTAIVGEDEFGVIACYQKALMMLHYYRTEISRLKMRVATLEDEQHTKQQLEMAVREGEAKAQQMNTN